jgi:hypothetical protein
MQHRTGRERTETACERLLALCSTVGHSGHCEGSGAECKLCTGRKGKQGVQYCTNGRAGSGGLAAQGKRE